MNRLKAFVLATCLLMLIAIMAAPVYADNTGEKENIQPSVSGNVQDKKLAEAGHPSPDATIKVAEILTEKKPAVPEKHPVVPEVSHIQQNAEMSLKNEQKVELSTDKHAQDKQEKQDKNADSSIDASYKSNKTAVKAVERNITLFTDRLKEKFSI
jgi:type IV secretory pathway VirB10-like protein